MRKNNQKIQKIKDIIKKSGHSFHYQVIKLLREKDWFVLVSPYYTDNITGKSREIDIIAEKEFDVKDDIGRSWLGTLNVQLFIECKQINQEHIFWFDNKDLSKAIKRIMMDTSLKSPEENATIEKHHYLIAQKVAKLYSSSSDKRLENETIYNAVTQTLHSMIYYRNIGSIMPPKKNKLTRILKLVSYPIIILNSFDHLYRIDPPEQKLRKIDNNFLIEVNYAYLDKDKKNRLEYFLIDVIEFGKLIPFLENLEKADSDIGILREWLYYRYRR